MGLTSVLGEAFVSAREAYGFHVEGETKQALKALGELRKNILEDVTKAQGATRDLISSLWRDFARSSNAGPPPDAIGRRRPPWMAIVGLRIGYQIVLPDTLPRSRESPGSDRPP